MLIVLNQVKFRFYNKKIKRKWQVHLKEFKESEINDAWRLILPRKLMLDESFKCS